MGRIAWKVVCESVTLVSAHGAVGLLDRPRLDAAIMAGPGGPVVVDLTKVRLIDAAIARALRNAGGRLARDGLRLVAAGATGQPLEVLEIVGIAKQLRADLTVPEAILECRQSVRESSHTPFDAQVHQLVARARAVDVSPESCAELLNEAIETALPLARTLARQYRGAVETSDDLMQVAALGLVNAVHGYDPDWGNGFLAYAVPTIRGTIRRHLRDYTWILRPSRPVQETRNAASSAWPELAQTPGRTPTTQDLATWIGTDDRRVEEAAAVAAGRQGGSLDSTLTMEPVPTWHDVTGAEDGAFERLEHRMVLGPVIAALPAQDRAILALRMGTDLTQAQIGERLGTSQMGVSRSLTRTLNTLSAALDPGTPAPRPTDRPNRDLSGHRDRTGPRTIRRRAGPGGTGNRPGERRHSSIHCSRPRSRSGVTAAARCLLR